MAVSTTATATHVLLKYSKSNPSMTAGSPDQWQHYVNPLLTLVLDVKKSATGQLQSVRLRVVWTMNHATGPSGTEVVFEDVDLLSFSSLKPQQLHPPQGVPLKAVYKDAVVGIRYLHSCVPAPGPTPVYRRFQVTFSTPFAASQFIESIRNVCPCKENGPPAPRSTFAMLPPTSSQAVPVDISRFPASNTTAPTPASQMQFTQNPMPAPVSSPFILPAAGFAGGSSQPSALDLSSSPRPQTSCSYPANNLNTIHPVQDIPPQGQADPPPIAEQLLTVGNPPKPTQKLPNQTVSFPDSTHPASLTSSSISIPAPSATSSPPSETTTDASRTAFLASLRENPELDTLSREELEDLVATVIRQPGFVKLLETLDSMWMVKGYLAR